MLIKILRNTCILHSITYLNPSENFRKHATVVFNTFYQIFKKLLFKILWLDVFSTPNRILSFALFFRILISCHYNTLNKQRLLIAYFSSSPKFIIVIYFFNLIYRLNYLFVWTWDYDLDLKPIWKLQFSFKFPNVHGTPVII